MGISDEIKATTIVIDEGTILEIKATITFISINFDNPSQSCDDISNRICQKVKAELVRDISISLRVLWFNL